MATKAERTIVVSDAIYMKIYRLAEKEQTNIPFVVRQLLVKGLADERTHPDWFFEMQREIVGLRNDVLAAQRKNEKQDLSGEQLLLELKKQIAELKEALVVAPEKAKVESEDEKAYDFMLWPEIEKESVPVLEPVLDAEPVEVVVSINQQEKGKVIRPFFGRLSQMFSSVLS
ncbi:MAG: hypothetical protein WCT03_02535 [Candidatus Obscuribacterales bacterium]|jgi:hypothetical protein